MMSPNTKRIMLIKKQSLVDQLEPANTKKHEGEIMKPAAKDAFNFTRALLISFFILVISACGGGGGGGGGGGQQTPGPQPVDVNGGGVKGPLVNAIVSVYLLDYSQPGFKGNMVGSGTTGDDAAITGLSFVPVANTPYLIEFTSDDTGTPPTTDLTTGQAPVITTLRTVVDASQLSSLLYGTPLTTAAVDLAMLKADSNVSPYTGDNSGDVTEAEFLAALDIARAQVLSVFGFGLSTDTDIFAASPIINANTTDEASLTQVAAYRTAIEAMTAIVFEMATNAIVTTDEMFAAVINDLADDGDINASHGAPITAAEITIFQNPNPGALLIPNTSTPVNDVETILVAEQAGTGNGGVDPSPMLPVDPSPADPVSDIDGDSFPDTTDNCPMLANDQTDTSGNGIGDACDSLVAIPDVVGMTQVNAEAAITGAFLIVGNVTSDTSLTVAEGNVISQAPESGDVLQGTAVDLVISSGPPTATMPPVIGMSRTEAINELETLGFTNINVNTQPDLTPIDQVIGQSPSAGSVIPITDTINLTVSDGIVVPNVIGMSLTEATNTLESAGLSVIDFQEPNNAPIGQVFNQFPASGNNLNPNDQVQIFVSIGVLVPNVLGMTEANATSTLQGAGFNVSVNPVENNAPIGQVVSQTPFGVDAEYGSTVIIDVSAGVPVPDVVGNNSTAATSTLETAGFTVNEIPVDSNAPVGEVVSQTPNGGENASYGSEVTIFVSSGIAPTAPDVSGIWRLSFTPLVEQSCVNTGMGHAHHLQIHPELAHYISIEQLPNDSSITVHFLNGESSSGTIANDNSFDLPTASHSWTDADGLNAQSDYTLSGIVMAGATNTITGTLVNVSVTGGDNCGQTLSYTAERVYQPDGLDNYTGSYVTESLEMSDAFNSEPSRESFPYDMGINGSEITIAFMGEYGELVNITAPVNYDPAVGVATANFVENIPVDFDGDGQVNDLEVNETYMVIMFVRSDSDTSTLPTIAFMSTEERTYYQNTLNPAPGTPSIEVAKKHGFGYGKLVQATGFTVSSREPINNSPDERNAVRLGIRNPPLLNLDALATNTFEIVENASGVIRCSGDYPSRYRYREMFTGRVNLVDMTQEEFLPYAYSLMNCWVDAANVIDNGAYTMNIRNSSNVIQYSYQITAEPTSFASSIPNRRAISVNGAESSQSERGDVIWLYGYFNASFGNTLPVVVPVSTDPDIDYYRLRFTNGTAFPNTVAEFVSNTNSFVLPGDTILDSENGNYVDMRIIERYLRSGDRRAQAMSRRLRMQAGIRGLVNSEIRHPVTGQVWTAQFWLDGSNEFVGGTECVVTSPLDGTLTCDSATINFNTNTITSQVTFFGQQTTTEVTFTDSVNGTVVVYDPSGNWTGTARVVNPELITRSQIGTDGNMRTDIIYVNPLAPIAGPNGGTGILTSTLNQDLGNGAGNSFNMWNNNYSDVFNSFMETPLDGMFPQSTGSYRANSFSLVGPTVATPLAADTFTLVENGRTFRTNYGGEDPTSMDPPDRSQIFIDFGAGEVSASTFTYVAQTEITAQPVTLSWVHTPSALPADTRWQIRLREVVSSGTDHVQHSEVRTQRLADGEAGLSYDSGTGRWTWVVPPEFQIPSTGIWKFNVRVSDPANTVRGLGQGVVMVDQVANP